MKLTLIRTDRKNKRHLKLVDAELLTTVIRDEETVPTINKLREFMTYAKSYLDFHLMYRLPVVFPSASLKLDSEGNCIMREFNGLLTLTVGPLNTTLHVEALKKAACILPFTVAAFTGSSGMTVKIILKVCSHDGTLPQTADEAERFCEQAYALASGLYEVALKTVRMTDPLVVGPAVRPNEKSLLMTGFRMTYDNHPVVVEHPIALCVPEGVDTEDFTQPIMVPDAPVGDDVEHQAGQETRSLIQYLEERYFFRLNKVMGYVEYQKKEKWHYGWLPVDERVQNGLAVEARLAGLNVWDKDINRYLRSNLIRQYDPIDEYLWNVHDKWDGKDHIGRLAQTVPTDNPHWEQWFRTWFLGMVMQWRGRSPRYGNAMAPLLISKQGCNKSTFCKSLIPPELQWGYTDNLVLSEKKSVLQAMSQFLLINLDEFNQISPKVQEGFLKNLIQLASVKVKRPYGKHVEEFPRLASFIATANVVDLLADPSGNRRFIGVELTGPIDVKYRINHEQLYAQAIALLDRGGTYWLDEEQTRLVMESNRQFQLRTPEEMFFREYFTIPEGDEEGQWMTAAAIQQAIKQRAGSLIRNSNIRSFGRFLANIDTLQQRRSRYGAEYFVKLKKQ